MQGGNQIQRSFIFAFLFFCSITPIAQAQKPNFVFIMADDCTFRDLECYGGQAKSPNMNQLVKEGMKFERCFQNSPMCSPTRHNIYTGLYPIRSGAYPNHTFVPKDTKSVVQYLEPLGYRVALSGKTHISPKSVFSFEYSGKKNPDAEVINRLFQECKTTGTPFCLFACSNEPHSPWDKGDASAYPPDEIELPPFIVDTPEVREEFSKYLAEITYYDSQVGEILRLLKDNALDRETLVMVVSEQGNSFPFAKWTCYGNGLQSAMIVRWPGRIEAETSTDAIVEYTDVLPTFLDLAGINTEVIDFDGKSFANVLFGKTDKHREYTCGQMTTRGIINGSDAYGIRTIRDERYRFIWNLHHETTFTNACTSAGFYKSMVKLAESGDERAKELVRRYQHRPEFELYDCEADPLEMENLIDEPEHQDLVAKLKQELQEWMDAQGDKGKRTEEEALAHLGKYRGMDPDEAYDLWKGRKKTGSMNKK